MENERLIKSGVELDKNQANELLNLKQKTDNRLKEIEEKYKDNNAIISRAKYILSKKDFLISIKFVMKYLFNVNCENNVLSITESKELNSLSNDIYHKMLELENKLEEYIKTL
ncbi:MAG: hypothetical protein ACLU8Y_01905 [Clostridia bacterium]